MKCEFDRKFTLVEHGASCWALVILTSGTAMGKRKTTFTIMSVATFLAYIAVLPFYFRKILITWFF